MQLVNKMNEFQETEYANNSVDDVAEDLLKAAAYRPLGQTLSRSTTLPCIGTIPSCSSITQSSFIRDGQPDVMVSFLAEYAADGLPHFTLRAYSLTTETSSTISTRDQEASSRRVEGIPAADWKAVELRTESTSYYHYADLFSDIANNADADYLAMGYWLRVTKERSSTVSSYALGIGAGGSDPFPGENVTGLKGTATYEGRATGLHMRKENAAAVAVFDRFNARASLMANFGDAGAVGTVSGTITEGMTVGGEAVPELMLGFSGFTPSRRTFGGDTSGDGLAGKWGGKFYSNGASSADHPGSMAGTFGAKTADDLQSFIGAFAVYRE